LKTHPEVKVEADGFSDFKARVDVKFDRELEFDESCVDELKKKLDPLLDMLSQVT
jgi:hypothetical protein